MPDIKEDIVEGKLFSVIGRKGPLQLYSKKQRKS
jgi:hypothetical protein